MRIFYWVFGVVLFLFFIAVMRIEINRSGREISQLQNEVEIKEARNQYLQLEVSRMSGPENVIHFAETELGLQPAKPHEIVTLEEK